MMRFVLSSLLLIIQSLATNAQTRLNIPLKKELDSLQILDQKYRQALIANMRGKGDSLAIVYRIKKEDLNDYLWKLQGELDSLNTFRVEEIINKYGYPGISLVGKPTNEVAFYIIQHSRVIDKYLPVLREAAESNELRFELYAIMLDRSLMFQDKEQVYGTQGSGIDVKNTKTGIWENLTFIWPIKDPLAVNERRKAAGFTQTVEEGAKNLGIKYKVFTLEEIIKLRNEVLQADKN
ncbi:DUF6624 domain-containing protein [Flavihumibacter sp. ZG627]|uniref:DUF6624 domain-containing protein n=1 Tax=Flavihumibacter sp. ZG627 TaxID=1463156 RepID=UPI00057E17F7|nr:DUF6624 domain-containing protein [Flavihumibacter sp. ZG627]KIC89824.1 hypothetical protein HY58_14210 [Flavihumibacter sp. ZG627]